MDKTIFDSLVTSIQYLLDRKVFTIDEAIVEMKSVWKSYYKGNHLTPTKKYDILS